MIVSQRTAGIRRVALRRARTTAGGDAHGEGATACGPLDRLLARLFSGRLDRALAAGADPATSPRLAARAAILTSPGTRAELARCLEGLVAAAHGPHRRWWAASQYATVLANAEELQALAGVLRGPVPAYARGLALLHELVRDGAGPAHQGRPEALAGELARAWTALAGSR